MDIDTPPCNIRTVCIRRIATPPGKTRTVCTKRISQGYPPCEILTFKCMRYLTGRASRSEPCVTPSIQRSIHPESLWQPRGETAYLTGRSPCVELRNVSVQLRNVSSGHLVQPRAPPPHQPLVIGSLARGACAHSLLSVLDRLTGR